MPEEKKPVEVKEDPETTIANLSEENLELKKLLRKQMDDNQILRATLKALAQLL